MKTAELKPEASHDSVEELREVLEDLLRLLDEYGPAWYSEELHDRIVNALLTKSR